MGLRRRLLRRLAAAPRSVGPCGRGRCFRYTSPHRADRDPFAPRSSLRHVTSVAGTSTLHASGDLTMTDRRKFLGAIAALSAGAALPLDEGPASDAWLDQLKGKHRQLFDAPDPDG